MNTKFLFTLFLFASISALPQGIVVTVGTNGALSSVGSTRFATANGLATANQLGATNNALQAQILSTSNTLAGATGLLGNLVQSQMSQFATTNQVTTACTALQSQIAALTSNALQNLTQNLVISCWGDSLTAGAGAANGYPYYLSQLSGVPTINNGVGGLTSTQICTNFLAHSAQTNNLTIIWAGRNDYWPASPVVSNVATMAAALGHSNFLVLSVINWPAESNGTSSLQAITKLNSMLSSAFPGRFLDIRKVLVSTNSFALLGLSPTQDDLRCIAQDSIPSSLVVTNDGHLNDYGYRAVAYQIYSNWFAGAQVARIVGQGLLAASTNVSALDAKALVSGGSSIFKAADGSWQANKNIICYPDASADLGGDVYRWRSVYFGGTAYGGIFAGSGSGLSNISAGGVVGIVSNAAALNDGSSSIFKANDGSWQANKNIICYPDASADLGGDVYRWRNGYFGGRVSAGTFAGSSFIGGHVGDGSQLTNVAAAALSAGTSALFKAADGSWQTSNSIICYPDSIANLGGLASRWASIYFGGTAYGGTFSGSGSGLTNIQAASIVGKIASSNLFQLASLASTGSTTSTIQFDAVYKTITLGGDYTIAGVSGTGCQSLQLLAGGSNRSISLPFGWYMLNTNGLSTDGSTCWTATLTNGHCLWISVMSFGSGNTTAHCIQSY